jgi:DNA (cytosine-5)-methyltransferase 1
MRILDLFAGIGGFSLAGHWMGWQTAAFVERDKFCQRVLAKNFGARAFEPSGDKKRDLTFEIWNFIEENDGAPIFDDIFDFSEKPFRGIVDIVTGGFPCQPFSAAGKRKGRADERHLFPEMLRVIREVKPRWVVAENVRGLLSIESGAVFAEVVSSLEGEGYEVITFCVPASAVGAPHRRDRLWIVASHADRVGKRAGHREIQGSDGEISERHNDAESGNAGQYAPHNSERAGLKGCAYGIATVENCDRSNYRLSQPSDSDVADTCCKRRQQITGSTSVDESPNEGRVEEDDNFTASHSKSHGWTENWLDVATRTCVRGVDDGLSSELDVVGARDNRVSRLKALGNSVVPVIPYEIFKAIEAAEQQTNG